MEYPADDIASLIEEEAKKYPRVPVKVAKAVILKGENFGNKTVTDATNPDSGASGIGQLIPATRGALIKQGRLPADTTGEDSRRVQVRESLATLDESIQRTGNIKASVAEYIGGTKARKEVEAGGEPSTPAARSYVGRVLNDDGSPAVRGSKGATVVAGASEELLAYQARNVEFIKALRDATTGVTNANTSGADALAQLGDVAAESALNKGAVEVAKLDQANRTSAVFHARTDDPNSVITRSEQQRQDAQLIMRQLKPVIDAEDQVEVWDDPLRWIANQFTQPGLKRAYNAAYATEAQATANIEKTQRITAAQQLIDLPLIGDQIKKQAALDAAGARFKALKEIATLNGNSAEHLSQLTLREMQNNSQEYVASVDIAKMSMQALGYDYKDMADTRAAEALVPINQKMLALGQKPYTPAEFEFLPAKQKAALMASARYSSLGADPGSSLLFVLESGAGPSLREKMPQLDKFIREQRNSKEFTAALQVVNQNPRMANMELNDKLAEAMSIVASAHSKELSDKKEKNSLLSDNNPYKFKLANAVILPELKGNPFVKVVEDAIAVSPDKMTAKDEDVMRAYLAKVQADPKSLPVLAKQLSDFYTIGSKEQWKQAGPAMMGYPKPQGYGISGDALGMPGERAIQMASPAEIENWTLLQLAKKKKQQTAMYNGMVDANSFGMDPFLYQE